ncbi:hypothetical protein D3C86_1999720 [compost metagenome]
MPKGQYVAYQVRAGPLAHGLVVVVIHFYNVRALAPKLRRTAGAANNPDNVRSQFLQMPTQVHFGTPPIQFALIVFDGKSDMRRLLLFRHSFPLSAADQKLN